MGKVKKGKIVGLNIRRIKWPKVGEYVLLTRYPDRDPRSPWFVGWLTRIEYDPYGQPRYYAETTSGEEWFECFKNCFKLGSIRDGIEWIYLATLVEEHKGFTEYLQWQDDLNLINEEFENA